MRPSGRKIAIIGAGNMGEALIRGLLQGDSMLAEDMVVSDVRKERLERIRDRYGIPAVADNLQAICGAGLIILAVKPQDLPRVLEEAALRIEKNQLVISIAAGIPTRFIESRLPEGIRVVRVMPNAPALVLAGATALAKGSNATDEDIRRTREIFDALGATVIVDEGAMDAVTGLSGSGPAYVFMIIEALAEAGVKMGLSRTVALTLTVQTLIGAGLLLRETGKHPAELKDMVTSPGGTTAAGCHMLEKGGLRGILIDAVEAATRRSQDLGKGILEGSQKKP